MGFFREIVDIKAGGGARGEFLIQFIVHRLRYLVYISRHRFFFFFLERSSKIGGE